MKRILAVCLLALALVCAPVKAQSGGNIESPGVTGNIESPGATAQNTGDIESPGFVAVIVDGVLYFLSIFP